MPGKNKYASVKHVPMYKALRRRGYSKSKSARIANAYMNGSLARGGRRRKR